MVLLMDALASSAAPPWFSYSLPSFSYRSLQPQSRRGTPLTWTPVPPWVLGNVSTAREICPAGETQTTLKRRVKYQASAPLLLLLTVLRMKATPAQQSSSWCSLWPLLHSYSAESTWLRSTSLTMNYEQCASLKSHQLLEDSCCVQPVTWNSVQHSQMCYPEYPTVTLAFSFCSDQFALLLQECEISTTSNVNDLLWCWCLGGPEIYLHFIFRGIFLASLPALHYKRWLFPNGIVVHNCFFEVKGH